MAYFVELTIFLDDRNLQKVAKGQIHSLPFVFFPHFSNRKMYYFFFFRNKMVIMGPEEDLHRGSKTILSLT